MNKEEIDMIINECKKDAQNLKTSVWHSECNAHIHKNEKRMMNNDFRSIMNACKKDKEQYVKINQEYEEFYNPFKEMNLQLQQLIRNGDELEENITHYL